MLDIRIYGYLEAHYLIVDAQLTDRVTVQEAPEYRSLPMDGENLEPAAMVQYLNFSQSGKF